MNLSAEKERIKHQIDMLEDDAVLNEIKALLKRSYGEQEIKDEDMGIPGIKPTAAQLEAWLDKEEGKAMIAEEAIEYIKAKAKALKEGK